MGTSPVSSDASLERPKRRYTRAERRRLVVPFLAASIAMTARSVAALTGHYRLSLILVPVLVASLGFAFIRLRSLRPEAGAAEGEAIPGPRTVTAILDGLGPDWQVLHGVEVGRERIDHLLVGPAGAFVAKVEPQLGRIEVDTLDRETIAGARAGGEALERISGLAVKSLLVFTDGHLAESPVARVGGVIVVPAPVLATYLDRLPAVFSAAEIAEVGEALRLALEVDAAPAV